MPAPKSMGRTNLFGMQKDYATSFLSCDWGTSRLRLRLVDTRSLDILGEVDSELGIAKVYGNWQKEPGPTNRTSYYTKALKNLLVKLENCTGKVLAALPVICSGMGSSSLGILELPYAGLPYAIDGSDAHIARLTSEEMPNPIFLISGVKSESDVMRGEETELVGMHLLLKVKPKEYCAIIPGTHSKHVRVRGNNIIGFETFMTGELFNILLSYSTLGHSVKSDGTTYWADFFDGIDKSAGNTLSQMLFQVRVNELLHAMDKHKNYSFLSGLLIGAELNTLGSRSEVPLILLGNSALNPLYAAALKHLGKEGLLSEIPVYESDRAVLKGQYQIFKELNKPV